jgi:hypothetical protein
MKNVSADDQPSDFDTYPFESRWFWILFCSFTLGMHDNLPALQVMSLFLSVVLYRMLKPESKGSR